MTVSEIVKLDDAFKMLEQNFPGALFRIDNAPRDESSTPSWTVEIQRSGDDVITVQATAPTLPLAICAAALQA